MNEGQKGGTTMTGWKWKSVLFAVVLCALGSARGQTLSVSPQGDDVAFTWSGVASNTVYALEAADDLAAPNWNRIPAFERAALPETSHVFSPVAGEGAQYFRLEAIDRGELLSSGPLTELSALALTFLQSQVGIIDPVLHGADVHFITYRTVDGRGREVTASAAVAVPTGGLPGPYPLMSWQHGTVAETNNAPSVVGSNQWVPAAVMAGQGFISVAPDFVGLGIAANQLHPYLHAEASANAVVDALRATRQFVAGLPQTENGKVFLAGYSQGGQATMAAIRQIERDYVVEFELTASAPMAGPYDLSGVMADRMVNTNQVYASPSYLPYVLFAYNKVYELYTNVADVLVAPYDTTLPPLFDGTFGTGAIDAAMPSVPALILKPAYRDAFIQDPNHPLRLALEENDLWNWTPSTQIRIYHCAADAVVPFTNAQKAYDQFILNGSTSVTLVDPNPAGSHSTCTGSAFQATLTWFKSLNQ